MNTQSRAVGAIARCGFGILVAWYVGCAGSDTPPVDNDVRDGLADNYGGAGAETGSAGTASGAGGGTAGSASAGSSNSGGGAAGSGGGAPIGGSGGGGAVDLGDACDAYTTIFLVQCAGSSCHGDGSDNGVFAGAQPPTPGELVNVASENGDACGVLVDPDNIENSVLLQMLTVEQDQNQACSPVPMPLAGEDLDATELECVTEYLTALANN